MFAKEFGYTPQQIRSINFVDERILLEGLIEAYSDNTEEGSPATATEGRQQSGASTPQRAGVDVMATPLSDLGQLGIQVESDED